MDTSRQQNSSWEVYTSLASQEIPSIIWNTNVLYSVYKSSPLAPMQIQRNRLHTFPLYFFAIHFNIIL
jgi:hypothetical protein